MTEKTEKIKITKYFSKPSCSKGQCILILINSFNLELFLKIHIAILFSVFWNDN